jgi:hypothetical protein
LKPEALSKKAAQELAAAVDTGLIPASFYQSFKGSAPASEALTETLLAKC